MDGVPGSASADGFWVDIETPYDGMSRRQWMPRMLARAVGLAALGLLGSSISPGPSAAVLIRKKRSVYRRYPVADLDEATALAARLTEELRMRPADDVLRRNPSVRR